MQVPNPSWLQKLNIPTTLNIRRAATADIPFMAKVHYEASLPPLNHCVWADILTGLNTDTMTFLEAFYRVNACAWGSIADGWILEEHSQPVAAATGYTPNQPDYRLIKSSSLNALAAALGWTEAALQQFWQQYEALWGKDPQDMSLKPQADWIVEFVAVMPEARGRGLVKPLLNAVLEAGRQQGYTHAGIMVVNGNEPAQRVYESLGFKPYVTFAADYYDDRFPGITRLRLKL